MIISNKGLTTGYTLTETASAVSAGEPGRYAVERKQFIT